MHLHYTFAAQSFGSDPSSEGGDLNACLPPKEVESECLCLVVLAAGMGSRYGGLKQLDPVGPRGEILLDYSVYDAVAAGFSEVIFIIRKDIEEAFRQTIGDRYRDAFPELKVRYAFQELHDLPEGFTPPVGRTKPWGTGHALLAARRLVQSPFAVINADDYYGASGYRVLQQFLTKASHGSYAMVGYHLKNTLSEHGSVSRGICHSRSDEFLINIIERTTIRRASGKNCIVAEEKDGQIIHLTGEELVSLNFWGFTPDLFVHLEKEFSKFLKDHLHEENQLTAEFYLPSAINNLIKKETASVRLFPTSDPWFGLTYPADLPQVKKALQRMVVNIRATGRI